MRYMIERHLRERREAGQLPSVAVTRAEFVRLAVEAGWTQEEAEMQAKVAAVLRSVVRIGERMVKIEEGQTP